MCTFDLHSRLPLNLLPRKPNIIHPFIYTLLFINILIRLSKLLLRITYIAIDDRSRKGNDPPALCLLPALNTHLVSSPVSLLHIGTSGFTGTVAPIAWVVDGGAGFPSECVDVFAVFVAYDVASAHLVKLA